MNKTLKQILPLLRQALAEDVGSGDLTSLATIPQLACGKLILIAKAEGIICGLRLLKEIFQILDRGIRINFFKKDGEWVKVGEEVAIIKGKVRSLFAGERLALNFLQRLSGIATFTRRFVEAGKPYGMKIYDTRKTTPLWRQLEKYAVRVGGGMNHRHGLYDMILIKGNHIDACGGIVPAVQRALEFRRSLLRKIKLGVEVRSIAELRSILPFGPDLIMLDNMRLAEISSALSLIGGAKKPELEISGGITIERIPQLGRLGVRRVSVGAITHSAPALNLSFKYEK